MVTMIVIGTQEECCSFQLALLSYLDLYAMVKWRM